MKLVLTTTYNNVNGKWLDWWVKEMGPKYKMDYKQKAPLFPHTLTTKDPTSGVWANTIVELKEEDDLREADL